MLVSTFLGNVYNFKRNKDLFNNACFTSDLLIFVILNMGLIYKVYEEITNK